MYGLGDRATIHVGNAEELPGILPPQTFDLVYSFGVIHHSPHPRRIVEHVRQYMTAESELRLMVYSRISYKLFWIMKEEGVWDMSRIDELVARNSEAQTGCPVTYTYTDDSVRALLEGFRVLDVQQGPHLHLGRRCLSSSTSIRRRRNGRTSAMMSWRGSSESWDGTSLSGRRSRSWGCV